MAASHSSGANVRSSVVRSSSVQAVPMTPTSVPQQASRRAASGGVGSHAAPKAISSSSRSNRSDREPQVGDGHTVTTGHCRPIILEESSGPSPLPFIDAASRPQESLLEECWTGQEQSYEHEHIGQGGGSDVGRLWGGNPTQAPVNETQEGGGFGGMLD
ncbi:hypothetical protein KI688_004839 [Linnemannia hyalina]|uniref:Uncharacterized protein n=1 Tax=Linnemannia hyalina TaxID=64524 RepID=A0A9P8BPD4_9FUNG|nr:hypothetical protein KI688_004839 [Linnemannia hyalina]